MATATARLSSTTVEGCTSAKVSYRLAMRPQAVSSGRATWTRQAAMAA